MVNVNVNGQNNNVQALFFYYVFRKLNHVILKIFSCTKKSKQNCIYDI